MARLLQKIRTAIGAYDRVTMTGTRYVVVLSDDRLLVLRYEKGNVHVTVTQREFAELLAVREASIEHDYFLDHPRLWARSRSCDSFNRLAAAKGIRWASKTYPEIADHLGPELIGRVQNSFRQQESVRAAGADVPSSIEPTHGRASK